MIKKIKTNLKKIFSEEFRFWEVIILMILTAFAGITVGGIITQKNYGIQGNSYNNNLQEFINNYQNIINNYYGELDENKLLDKALQSILEDIGDPYAAYMDETESANFDIQLAGKYNGLGIEIGTLVSDGSKIITTVFEDSPAYIAGLLPGDIIIKINDETIEDLSSNDLSKKIKEQSGEFELTIIRDSKEINFNIALGDIILKSVYSTIFENDIGYIDISIFADNTYEQFKDNLENLEKANIKSLIIDVRDNTGGYLKSVENILGLFLDSSNIIYQTEDKTGIKKFFSSGKITKTYPIVILTNRNSASASEILTAALKENIDAKSIGEKTFGKGSAQRLHDLNDGTKYKFTTQKWLTPKGNSIDGLGIDVDLEIQLDKKYYENPSNENDNQLQEAIKFCQKEMAIQ